MRCMIHIVHAGLAALRQGLKGPGGASLLDKLLLKSPELNELRAIWEIQLTVTFCTHLFLDGSCLLTWGWKELTTIVCLLRLRTMKS